MQHALMRRSVALIERGIATRRDVDIAVRTASVFVMSAADRSAKGNVGLDVNYWPPVTVFRICATTQNRREAAAKVKAARSA